ncbi:MAG: pyridoxamine 5'-phosphate oxidase family protein [Solirubrobacterales bacterium]|nr:pyridoxamine 5'-phosphate oxidase family protein [Solirubrobacterales bacterium]
MYDAADHVFLPTWPPGTVMVLATQGETPHAIPVSAAVRAGPTTALVALGSQRSSLARLRSHPHVALVVLAAGDLAITAHGRASVLEESLVKGVAAVRVEVERIQDHGRQEFVIESGVRWRWTDEHAQERDVEVRSALDRLAAGA